MLGGYFFSFHPNVVNVRLTTYSFSHFPVQLCNNLSVRKGIKKPCNSEKRSHLFSLVFSEALSFELQSKNCVFFPLKCGNAIWGRKDWHFLTFYFARQHETLNAGRPRSSKAKPPHLMVSPATTRLGGELWAGCFSTAKAKRRKTPQSHRHLKGRPAEGDGSLRGGGRLRGGRAPFPLPQPALLTLCQPAARRLTAAGGLPHPLGAPRSEKKRGKNGDGDVKGSGAAMRRWREGGGGGGSVPSGGSRPARGRAPRARLRKTLRRF